MLRSNCVTRVIVRKIVFVVSVNNDRVVNLRIATVKPTLEHLDRLLYVCKSPPKLAAFLLAQ